ncbi:lipoprotein-releasing system permease protein [Oceanospirillum multiglobuliferum]|uniref:ABC transporter permease n=1 Tax=Oceanospirillum multiglobuliferum TaxID=64969 RepID=A0A1T4R479_9GAMM|nr:lipoprotein-releasing ABC transporter permease subunit [Oceanospirillum multiglobuliferum]OPX55244.1 ABC transporter permease [Oceanospirillum multiglobuliferum]SKA10753.1 lipoprotein-releasing system permease protein [Oceanospirillum multiglobuliferum]
MFDKIPFLIGLRYTRAKRRNHFISFISLTSMIGLTLGVAVLILVLSVMNGFDRELRERILGMVPHATISSTSGFLDWPNVAQQLEQDPRIIAAVPYVKAQGMFTSRGNVRGALINGVLPEQEGRVSIIDQHMKAGHLDDLKAGEFGIILGDLLARFLGVNVGDKVTLMLPEASITPAGVFPRMKRFTVVGLFSVGADLDSNLAVAHLGDMQTLMRLGDDIHGVRLQLTDLFDARRVVWEQLQVLPKHLRGSDWTRTHGNLFQAIQMEKRMIGLLLMIVIAVAAFNIVSTLIMVVTDKQGDIAILRTLGATPGTIMAIFMVQGTVIGLTGTLIGTVLGVLAALNVSDFVAWVEQLLGVQFLDSSVYFISYLPSELKIDDVWVITGAALVMSFLSTLYPAWRASRIQPADALRYE